MTQPVKIGSVRDLPAGRMRAAKAGDRDILVVNLDVAFRIPYLGPWMAKFMA